MEDPFGLLEATNLSESKENKPDSHPKRAYLWVLSISIGLILILGLYTFQLKRSVSADTNSGTYLTSVKLDGLPTSPKAGDEISATLSVSNTGQNQIKSSFVLVQSSQVDLSQTTNLSQNLSETDAGYLRKLTEDEYGKFDQKGTSGFYWFVGDLKPKQIKSQQVKGKIMVSTNSFAKVEAKYFIDKIKPIPCGVLNLQQCQTQVGITQVGAGLFQLDLVKSDKLQLKSGYNFISLPYVFTSGSIKDFLSSLKDHWAYYYQPTTGEYLDLNKDNNPSLIKPGIGFWIYDSAGGEYDLPETKVESNPNESMTLNLDIGWNQIGNPYPKRLAMSSEKILVREIADDGSATGTTYSLKMAIDNGVLSNPYIVSYSPATGSSGENLASLLSTKVLALDSIISPYSGLMFKSTKKINLIFPGQEVIAPGDQLTQEEKTKLEQWIVSNGLNQYGDTTGTAYSGGNPLLDEKTGQTLDRLDYIIIKHPDRPWNQ
ncbi:MAG: hypothetical protein NTZ65_04200 [Candidatus Berkelbacteria bacterium]|nr:hypothetical protein [Candidatus Berkelbacteria bacterium]